MEIRPGQLDAFAPRRVEPTHASAWPVQRPRPFHEALADSGERLRDADRVEFSAELQRLNAERDERELRCDDAECRADNAPSRTEPTPAAHGDTPPSESAEIVRTIEHRYEVTRRSTTGRLIDMLM